jgi:uncharacterized coiled-coil protein SlyX
VCTLRLFSCNFLDKFGSYFMEYVYLILSAVFGVGGGGGVMWWWLEKRGQDHNQEMDLSDRLESRLNKVENRLDETKDEVDRLKERETELVYKINILCDRIGALVGKLDKYDELTLEEKEKLTSIPEYKS